MCPLSVVEGPGHRPLTKDEAMSLVTRQIDQRIKPLVSERLRSKGKTLNPQRRGPLPAASEMLRVLIVDDCIDTVDSLGMLVEMWGHNAARAYDAAAALRIAPSYRPHVLLLDIALRKMNGCYLASLLRPFSCSQNALFVAITGCTSVEHFRLSQAAGFDFYFLKPVSPAIIERLLFLEQTRLAQAARDSRCNSRWNGRNLLHAAWRAMVGACPGATCFHDMASERIDPSGTLPLPFSARGDSIKV
jgi:CheY-like chemotaxis protein